MRILSFSFSIVLTCCLAFSLARADQATDQKAIETAVTDYVTAFNNHDAKKLASLWTAGGIYINRFTGNEIVGREAIQKDFENTFANIGKSRLEATSSSVQFVSPSVAIELGTASIVTPDAEPETSSYSAVYLKVNDAWLLDRITEDTIEVPTSNYEHLKDLEWAVGKWVDQSETDAIAMDCRWTKNRNFLVRQFSVVMGDEINFAGIQIIGWDPVKKQIRSWVFDSDGAYGDGYWTLKGKSWHVQTTGTLSTGAKTSEHSIITPVDENSFTFQKIEQSVDGQLLPNVPESLVVRQESAE